MDRRMREDWEADGSTDIYQRAHDKMIDILETYEPPPLSDSVRQDIREIVKEAEKEQGVG
jgi:trimethylamine--corrinoid protein Co-methyltransferase